LCHSLFDLSAFYVDPDPQANFAIICHPGTRASVLFMPVFIICITMYISPVTADITSFRLKPHVENHFKTKLKLNIVQPPAGGLLAAFFQTVNPQAWQWRKELFLWVKGRKSQGAITEDDLWTDVLLPNESARAVAGICRDRLTASTQRICPRCDGASLNKKCTASPKVCAACCLESQLVGADPCKVHKQVGGKTRYVGSAASSVTSLSGD